MFGYYLFAKVCREFKLLCAGNVIILVQVNAKKGGTVKTNRIILILLLFFSAVAAASAWAQQSEVEQTFTQSIKGDVYAAEREVNVLAEVDGDLVAAGQSITVDGNVTGDIIAAAQHIEIRSEVGDDLRAAGQHVRVTSSVAGHMVAAAQSITISQSVGDSVWLVGDTVEVRGNIAGDLMVRARKITIDAQIDGNTVLTGEALHLGTKANLRGDLIWRGANEADVSPEAIVNGEFIKEPLPGLAEEAGIGGSLSFTVSVIFVVMALFLLFTRLMQASADRVAAQPIVSLIIGLSVMFGMPLLAVLLIFLPLNAWVGLALLALYLVVLLLSVMTGLFVVSDLALRRFSPQPPVWQALAAIFVTVVGVGLLSYVPFVGISAVFAIWLLGVGAFCWGTWMALHKEELKN